MYIKFQTKRGSALSDLYVREALKKGAHYFFVLKEKGGTCDTLFSSLILTYLVPRYLKHLMHITDVLQISRALFRHPTRPLLLPGKNISAPIRRWGKIFSPLEEYTSLGLRPASMVFLLCDNKNPKTTNLVTSISGAKSGKNFLVTSQKIFSQPLDISTPTLI